MYYRPPEDPEKAGEKKNGQPQPNLGEDKELMARSLLLRAMPPEVVAERTGLPIERVRGLLNH